MIDIECGIAVVLPVAWIRYCTDGGVEGPLLHSQMEEVRIRSGAWTPLYVSPDLAAAQAEIERLKKWIADYPIGSWTVKNGGPEETMLCSTINDPTSWNP